MAWSACQPAHDAVPGVAGLDEVPRRVQEVPGTASAGVLSLVVMREGAGLGGQTLEGQGADEEHGASGNVCG